MAITRGRQDRAHKRYLAAIKMLAQVGRLQLPVMQVNLAGNGTGHAVVAAASERWRSAGSSGSTGAAGRSAAARVAAARGAEAVFIMVPDTPDVESVVAQIEPAVSIEVERPQVARRHADFKALHGITLDIPPSIVGSPGAFPQARAVIDDFGNLYCVRTWQ